MWNIRKKPKKHYTVELRETMEEYRRLREEAEKKLREEAERRRDAERGR